MTSQELAFHETRQRRRRAEKKEARASHPDDTRGSRKRCEPKKMKSRVASNKRARQASEKAARFERKAKGEL